MENNHLAPIDSLDRMRCENPSQHVVLIKNIAVFVQKLKVTEQLEKTLLANEISRDSSMRWVSHENYYECNSSKFVSEGRRCVQCWLCLLLPRDGAFDLGLAVSVPLPIVTGIFVLLWFQSRLT